jgi:hypothetical protein
MFVRRADALKEIGMHWTRRTATIAGVSALAGAIATRPSWADLSAADLNGWIFINVPTRYGTEIYSPELSDNHEAIYLVSKSDANGNPYRRGARYRIRFARGLTPPVRGSWSITAYGGYSGELPAHATIGSRDTLVAMADGTIDIYAQNMPPTLQRKSNWLEVPDDDFRLLLKMRWPNETSPSIFDGTWKPPAVGRIAYAYTYRPGRGF